MKISPCSHLKQWLSKFIRKILYEIPAMILILDTRLLLKEDLKPPWECPDLGLRSILESFLPYNHVDVVRSYRPKGVSYLKFMVLFAALGSLSLCLLLRNLWSSDDNLESVVAEVIKDEEVRSYIRKSAFLIRLQSWIHGINQVKDSFHAELLQFYKTQINNQRSFHPEINFESTGRRTLKQLKNTKDNQKVQILQALASVENWDKQLSSASSQLSLCLNHTKSRVEEIQYMLDFFLKEEVILLAQKSFINRAEHQSATQSVYDELLERVIALHRTQFSEKNVERIVDEHIRIYDSDKTGKFDFALESAGGSVLTTRCSESLINYKALYTIFGFNVWYPSHNPRLAIQHGTYPGECWAFKGSEGRLVIKLSNLMFPKEISIEHMPELQSLKRAVDSAPKDFYVYGLSYEDEEEPMILGEFSYSESGGALQSFPIQFPSVRPFSILELVITSNHGHPEYTCLYRFRAHGIIFS